MDKADAQYGPIFAKYSAMSIEQIAQDPQAIKMGSRLFANYCAICHGSDAKGSVGFPNLADQEWRWGGDPAAIKTSILQGRNGVMPAWGAIIGEEGVKNVAAYVRKDLAGLALPEGNEFDLSAGQNIYTANCAACHGASGQGMPMLGAPNLTSNAGWIYGSSLAQLQQTIRHGRNGVMPAQEQYLGEDKVHILAGYVYSLSRNKE